MASEGAFDRGQEPEFQGIYWRDEILQLMFWLRGEGLFEDAAPDDLRRFLGTDPGRLEEHLEQLVREGYLEPSPGDGRRYRLSALGIGEGRRRFVDEFTPFLGRESHVVCGDPTCECHTSGGRAPVFRTDKGRREWGSVMKIAVAGKGGSGKTTVAGTLSRMLGRQGRVVLAIDADSNPNLAVTLGIPREAAVHIQPVPREIMEDRLDVSGQHVRTLALSYPDVLARYSTAAADNSRVLLMGRVGHGGAG
jgi:CobQ/CobB/MinD/ParA nucleotide binding domain